MKRLLVPVCIIIIAIVLFSVAGNDGATVTTGPVSVSEAAYTVRTSQAEDATGFLVGRFSGNQGTNLFFDGSGEVKQLQVNLDTEIGDYNLTQARAGAALLKITFGGELKMYTFELASPEGDFRLTDADGNTEIFRPVLL